MVANAPTVAAAPVAPAAPVVVTQPVYVQPAPVYVAVPQPVYVAPAAVMVNLLGGPNGEDPRHRLAGGTDDRPGARLFLHGSFANLIGRVSMDLMAVDVTDLPQAKPGDLVELFGPNIPVDEMAAAAGTIGYEILTGFGRRFDRLYAGTE